MRVFLLPISTRRTLLYAYRDTLPATANTTYLDKIQTKAAETWSGWEKKESGWQKKLVNYGNYALRRIPYEEWGLKSVPPMSAQRQQDEKVGNDKVEVIYPKALISMEKATTMLQQLSTEREALHKRMLTYCLIGMPISAPFALVPVIPNIPFFYLAYRAWSHWRALGGGRHIQFLLKNDLLTYSSSPILDELYSNRKLPSPSSEESTVSPGEPQNIDPMQSETGTVGETMLIDQESGRKVTEALELPQLEVELERAIWQVETAIEKKSNDMEQARKKDN